MKKPTKKPKKPKKPKNPRVFGVDFETANVKQVAEMQKIYSSLMTEGVISEELYISATIILALQLFGINYDNTAELHRDMQCVHDVTWSLRKLKEKLNVDE